ncbi:cardioacceleratory peptide receptor-like isoform X2 [Biomphalaria glabrata]|uniref:Cardioacceleratory peptide receptor-like isoform X2 n=1 Tax=Biomphalaria glabrata TaxID=6526 RepID=A0A9W2Z5F1_BIOGL|nr:cardioacceleratory peptide receptor-like isoform X2 [Biomphalaria glabrata]
MTTIRDHFLFLSSSTTTPATPTTSHSVFSPNETSSNVSSYPDPQEYYKDAQIAVLVILFCLIVIGNVIVLAAIALSRERRRSRMNFFILHLAVCDLLTGPMIVLAELISRLTTRWHAGDAVCKIHKFSAVAVMYSSTYMLVALSIDRLDAVARPLHFSGNWLRAKILVLAAWIFSCLFAIPELILFKVDENVGPYCNIFLSQMWWKVYVTLVALSLFFIPALIILTCYVAIVILIFNSSSLVSNVSKRSKDSDTGLLRENSSQQDSRTSSQSSRGVIPQAKIRTIKMTFIIILVFIVCWSPYFIINMCQVFQVIPNTPVWMKINTFVQSLAPLNSAANPLIYGVFSTRICRYIRLTGDLRSTSSTNGSIRVPLVKQQLTESDRELLSMHVKGGNIAADSV